MQNSKQLVSFWYIHDFNLPNVLSDLAKKATKDLSYLLLPEDSTDREDIPNNKTIGVGTTNTRANIKTLFWIVTAIIIPLVIGQLAN